MSKGSKSEVFVHILIGFLQVLLKDIGQQANEVTASIKTVVLNWE